MSTPKDPSREVPMTKRRGMRIIAGGINRLRGIVTTAGGAARLVDVGAGGACVAIG